MLEEKIRCEYCGRKNQADNDLCLSCGAVLPDIPSLKSLVASSGVYSPDELRDTYLNKLINHSAFSMSIETGRLVGMR